MRDPALIAEAERLIAAGDQKIILGELRSGDGGFNAPWSWHMDPATGRTASECPSGPYPNSSVTTSSLLFPR